MLGRMCAGAFAVSLLLSPSRADAHGGTWLPDQVLVEPGQPSHVVLRSDAWGVIETTDGVSWHWLCAEAYGGDSVNIEHRGMALLPGGSLLVAGSFAGLWRSSADLCDFRKVGPFAERHACFGANCIVLDVTRAFDADRAVFAVTESTYVADASVQPPDRLWHSADAGTTWDPAPARFPTGMLVTSVVASPSDTGTVYATARPTPGTTVLPLASHDGGGTWVQATPIDPTQFAIALTPPAFRVQGIHPTRSSIAFYLLDFVDNSSLDPGPDRLFITTDGGTTLTVAYEATANLQGLAFSPDGSTVFIGGEKDGLLRANVADVSAKGSAAFKQIQTGGFCGLNWTSEGLLAGHSDLDPIRAFSLGLSTDSGATFKQHFQFCDVTLIACGSDASAGVCGDEFYGTGPGGGNFQFDFLDPTKGRCPETKKDAGVALDAALPPLKDAGHFPTQADGGKHPPGSERSTGCGCSVPSGSAAAPSAEAWSVLALLAARRRRRRAARI
jgi:MYXO-CTERM domain-containing protein